jgi:hypothetical protein
MFKDRAKEIALAAERAQRILDAKIAAEIKIAEERELARKAEAALLAQRIAEHGKGPKR